MGLYKFEKKGGQEIHSTILNSENKQYGRFTNGNEATVPRSSCLTSMNGPKARAYQFNHWQLTFYYFQN